MTLTKTNASSELGRIEKILIGNGREGLIPQVARIEEKMTNIAIKAETVKQTAEKLDEKTDKQYENTMRAIQNLTLEITKLTMNVEAHHKSIHLNDLLKKPVFYAYIAIAFIVLHEISTAVGFGLSDVFNWGLKLIGLH